MITKDLISQFRIYCENYGWTFDINSSEFTFQFRLGWFLNEIYKDRYLIDFETNVKKFEIPKKIKAEIDIYIYDKDNKSNHAIEIKYIKDRSGYDISLYKMCEDILFLEHLKETKIFMNTYVLVFSSVKNSFTAPENGKYKVKGERLEFYKSFREKKLITGKVYRNKEQQLMFKNEYKIDWFDFTDNIKACLIII